MKRNTLLFFALIITSLILAMPFGNLVNKYIFPGGSWSIPDSVGNFIDGFPFIWLFLSPIVFMVFGKVKKWMSTFVSILPVVVFYFYIGVDVSIWYWSLTFFIFGIIFAIVIDSIKKHFVKIKPAQLQ